VEHTYAHEISAAVLTVPSSPGSGLPTCSKSGHRQSRLAAAACCLPALTQRKESAIY